MFAFIRNTNRMLEIVWKFVTPERLKVANIFVVNINRLSTRPIGDTQWNLTMTHFGNINCCTKIKTYELSELTTQI